MKPAAATSSLHLTEACWPVFEFLTNFTRQVKHGSVHAPEQVRFEAVSALRDAEDLARGDPVCERAWHDRVRAALVYLLDYKMINTEWPGRLYWLDNPFETDTTILAHAQALGGEDFFAKCDELQREYEAAERRERRDKDELAEQLNIYFVCLRLGFKGMFHDRPQELADYTRRLFTRLPAYAATRSKEMFPEAYKHNQEVRVDYHLGMSLTIVVLVLVVVVAGWFGVSRVAWSSAVGELNRAQQKVVETSNR
jgi:type IV/VI secretion system ImpK/VasF family protein